MSFRDVLYKNGIPTHQRKSRVQTYMILQILHQSDIQIIFHQRIQQFIAVNFTDQTARIVVIGDIRRIFGKNIANDLVDGIISLFNQRTVNGLQCPLLFKFPFVCN